MRCGIGIWEAAAEGLEVRPYERKNMTAMMLNMTEWTGKHKAGQSRVVNQATPTAAASYRDSQPAIPGYKDEEARGGA